MQTSCSDVKHREHHLPCASRAEGIHRAPIGATGISQSASLQSFSSNKSNNYVNWQSPLAWQLVMLAHSSLRTRFAYQFSMKESGQDNGLLFFFFFFSLKMVCNFFSYRLNDPLLFPPAYLVILVLFSLDISLNLMTQSLASKANHLLLTNCHCTHVFIDELFAMNAESR